MIATDKDRDKRQFKLIIDVCDLYLNSKNSNQLWVTISKLEALIEALGDVDSIFKNKLRGNWGVLEDIFSASLYSPELNLIEQHKDDLDSAIAAIKLLVIRKI